MARDLGLDRDRRESLCRAWTRFTAAGEYAASRRLELLYHHRTPSVCRRHLGIDWGVGWRKGTFRPGRNCEGGRERKGGTEVQTKLWLRAFFCKMKTGAARTNRSRSNVLRSKFSSLHGSFGFHRICCHIGPH
jgi:hypothetical protein